MTISDIIEQFIKECMNDAGGSVELKRNELAGKFNCVPSQINYVISTRFTTERGYIVESRRGGGGGIIIKRIGVPSDNLVMHIVNCIGDSLDYFSANALIKNLLGYNIISQREAKIMLTALSDRVLVCNRPQRDEVRALMLKNMLLHLI